MTEQREMVAQGDLALQQRARLAEAAGATAEAPAGGEALGGEEFLGDGAPSNALARLLSLSCMLHVSQGFEGFLGAERLSCVLNSVRRADGDGGRWWR